MNCRVLRVNGPLFFAAAERIFDEINELTSEDSLIVLQWDAVPILDAGGLQAFLHFSEQLPAGKRLVVTDIAFQPLKTLARANVHPIDGRLAFYSTLAEALLAESALLEHPTAAG
jgi:SulP family sulfate permease